MKRQGEVFGSHHQKYKRVRIEYKNFADGTKVIQPFIKYKDLDDSLLPSLEDQNLIHEQNVRLAAKCGPGNHVKARMTETSGHPFFTLDCIKCGQTKHNYCFAIVRYGKAFNKTCNQCRNTRDKLKSIRQYSQEEMDSIRSRVALMLEEVSNTFLFNADKFTKFLERMISKGYFKVVDIILEHGVTYSVICAYCKRSQFLYHMVIDSKSKTCVRDCCNICQGNLKNQMHRKAGNLIRRFGERNIHNDGVDLIKNRLLLQRRLCHYSFIPMQDDNGPWKWSPERIERDGTYFGESQTVALCCEIFNVGGTRNFSHKLLLQTFFSNTFKVFYDEYLHLPPKHFMTMNINNAKNRSKKRGQKAVRWDQSQQFTIDREYIHDLAKAQGYRCALSGIPLVFQSKHPWTASLDRIDTFRGYVPGNVRWVIGRFNSRHTWDDAMWKVLSDSLDKNIHKVWERHYGENGPPYGQFLLNLCEQPPNQYWFPRSRKSAKKNIF